MWADEGLDKLNNALADNKRITDVYIKTDINGTLIMFMLDSDSLSKTFYYLK